MQKLFIATSIAVLAGCGSFNLGYVQAQAGKTADQQQLDTLACKDQAYHEANTAGRHVGSFLAGMTIIGAPIAIEAEKAKQREVFTACMQDRGYTITPADGTQPAQAAN